MTFGLYENFPSQIHRVESYTSTLSIKQLQQRIIQAVHEVNRREFSFEEIANPTIPQCRVIFEFGLAEKEVFNYLDIEELKQAIDLLAKEHPHTIDFFCVIRYYKITAEGKKALKFDYYLIRTRYSSGIFEIQIFHEKGPRYVAPEDLTMFISKNVNNGSKKKILRNSNR